MTEKQEKLYKKLGRPLIGGSYALKMGGAKLNRKPGDLDFCVTEHDFEHLIVPTMQALGAWVTYDFPNSFGFNLRRQYRLDGEKYDFFIISENYEDYHISAEGYRYVSENMVWAARGFYAAKGGMKYQKAMVDAGYWPESRLVPKQKTTNLMRRIVWFVRGLFC